MNDPWDVKSVRQSNQYMSCMKINGVPLLPPILSKECRKEMQYYKLLAKEVEKRINALTTFVIESETDTSTDKTDAPDFPESDLDNEIPVEAKKPELEVEIDKSVSPKLEKNIDNTIHNNTNSTFENITSNFTTDDDDSTSKLSSKLLVDLSLSVNDSVREHESTLTQLNDLPERDYDCNKKQKELLVDTDNINRRFNKKAFSDPISYSNFIQDANTTKSTKSFTGSLDNLHIEIAEDTVAPLIRHRSYTVLDPSPLLIAHLEVQSINKGIDVKSISMSESLSDIHCSNKKRRSWDLESAKVKWSSMAMELKEKNVVSKNYKNPYMSKKPISNNPLKPKVSQEKVKRIPSKVAPKSDSSQKTKKILTTSPVRNTMHKAIPKTPLYQQNVMKDDIPKQNPILDSDDPATRIRQLYEKIQKQQIIQMTNLVEKQKREQMLLQQVFEEQNNLLFTQLKNICPKSPIEVKEAWVVNDETNSGPVSLSQLINHKPLEELNSPVLSTLTETNNYLNHCDKVLKKSRDISSSLKKQLTKPKTQSPNSVSDGSRTRTQSPNVRNTPASRKLTYESSSSLEQDYDQMLTERTNDTLADLNITFTSDNTEGHSAVMSDLKPRINYNNSPNCNGIEATHSPYTPPSVGLYKSTDNAIKSMEETIQNSINSMYGIKSMKQNVNKQPTQRERAAATTIVAYAKGFLVRRLMKTERVQSTVQTIKDALLCALQLHEDREGIRGADVDLHRRLIQQITAACYSLHDTFVASGPAHRAALLAADRARRRALQARSRRPPDLMSQSHSGVFPTRPKRASPSLMTQSNYETFSGERTRRYSQSPRRRPWR